MGLAYNLETTLNPYLTQGLSNYFVNLPQIIQASKIELSGDPTADFFTPSSADRFNNNGWVYRWCGKSGGAKQACQGIFPTGEYVIRDITFTNGWYAMVGSYKATFLDLYGVGNHGVAWDGFLFMYRGYSDNVFIPFDADGTINRNDFASAGAGILPMRMPYDILPSTNSATTEAMDDVGLFSVDVWRGSALGGTVPQPGEGDIVDAYNIQLWLGGTQGISNPVAQGIPYTNVDRIAFGMAGAFGVIDFPELGGGGERVTNVPNYFEDNIGALPNDFAPYAVVGGKAGVITFNAIANMTLKFAWNATANDTMYFDPTAPMPATGLWRTADLEVVLNIGGLERVPNLVYDYETYLEGWQPNGTNIFTGATRADNSTAANWNYYPRRFMDMSAYSSQTTKNAGGSIEVKTPCIVGGDWWIGTDDPTGASPAAKIFPGTTAMAWDSFGLNITAYPNGGGIQGSETQAPYMSGCVSALSYKAIDLGVAQPSIGVSLETQALVKTDTLVANWSGLENSYFAFVTVPYENIGQDYTAVADNPSRRQPLIYIFANSITYTDGTIGTGIFQFEESLFVQDNTIIGFAFNGQRLSDTTTDVIPIAMANKWTAKCAQTRTFTVFEERNAKNFAPQTPGCGFFGEGCEPLFVTNSRNGESVGIRNNFPRLGIEPSSTEEAYNPDLNALKQQGSPSQEAYGAMGWRNVAGGIEPVVFVGDSGLGWFKAPGFDVADPNYSFNENYSNAFQNRGTTFNSKIINDPTSTSRACLGASWDNDRDQWIFLFSNFSAVVANQTVSPVSVTATFTDTARFGSAYLDQTASFADSPTAFNNAIWKSFPMTNNLDGLLAFGSTNKDFPFVYATKGVIAQDPTAGRDSPQGVYAKPTTAGNTRSFPTQSAGCSQLSDPGTISYNVSELNFWNLDGSTGRQAFVWVDYILFDGADAVIATKLRERGMKVTIDAVEWFKRKIINSGDLNIKQEEIEMWMRQQQDEFQMMMRDAERMGRVRKRKKQVSAYSLDKLETLNTDFEDKEVQEFMKSYIPQSRPPTPEEEMLERQRKGGYSPQSKSYYDEVFEN